MPYADIEVRKQYLRDYAARNREKLRAYQSEYQREWVKANPEKVRAKAQRYVARHPDRVKESYRAWTKRAAAFCNERCAARYTAKKQRSPKWVDEFDQLVFKEAFDLAKLREAATNVKWDVDHIIPLQGKIVSGLHVGLNIQVLPASVNRQKSNRYTV